MIKQTMSKDDIRSQLKLYKDLLKINEQSRKSLLKRIDHYEKELKKFD